MAAPSPEQQASLSNKEHPEAAQAHEDNKVYERKDDAYFGYYALLSHQAQMLQVRKKDGAPSSLFLTHLHLFHRTQ